MQTFPRRDKTKRMPVDIDAPMDINAPVDINAKVGVGLLFLAFAGYGAYVALLMVGEVPELLKLAGF